MRWEKRTLRLLGQRLAVCRLDPEGDAPPAAGGSGFFAFLETPGERTLICSEERAPREAECEVGWRALKVEGSFDFQVVGVLASLAAPLAEAQVPILVLSSYETDYLLVHEKNLTAALRALRAAGHRIIGVP